MQEDDELKHAEADSPFRHIPPELLCKIVSMLPPHEQARNFRVCRKWKLTLNCYFGDVGPYLDASPLSNRPNELNLLLRKDLTRTTSFNFQTCIYVDDGFLERVLPRCVYLTSIDLTGCIHVTNKTLQNLVKYCPRIARISLCGCSRITEYGLCKFTESVPQLKELNLMEFSVRDISFISKNCPNLEKLVLDNYGRIDWETVASMCTNLPKLRMLHLKDSSSNRFVVPSDQHSQALIHSWRNLKILRLDGIDLSVSLDVLVQSLPDLKMFSSTTAISSGEFTDLLTVCSSHSLQYLELRNSCELRAIAIPMDRKATSLRVLRMYQLSNLPPQSIMDLLDYFPNLYEVLLGECSTVNEAGIRMIIERVQNEKPAPYNTSSSELVSRHATYTDWESLSNCSITLNALGGCRKLILVNCEPLELEGVYYPLHEHQKRQGLLSYQQFEEHIFEGLGVLGNQSEYVEDVQTALVSYSTVLSKGESK